LNKLKKVSIKMKSGIGTLAVSASLILGACSPAATRQETAHRQNQAHAVASGVPIATNIVIVHGAFSDGSGWEAVYRTLKDGTIEATAPIDSTLQWDSPYLRSLLSSEKNRTYQPNIGDLTRPFMLPAGEWKRETEGMAAFASLQAGKRVNKIHEYLHDPVFVAEKNNQARLIREKRWGAPKLTRIVSADPSKPIVVSGLSFEVTQLEITPNTYVFRMAQDTPVQDGLIAEKNSDLEFKNTSEGLLWSRVCLAKDILYSGKPYKKGAVLIRLNGEVMELTKELAKRVPYSR
jgi:hypothetical protein